MAQFAATSSNSNNSSNSSTTAAGSTPGQVLMSSSNGSSSNLLRLASGTMGLGPSLTSSSPRTPSTTSAAPSSTCCEGGRPLVPDPLTGQPVCGCQLESAGSTSASAASMLLGLPSRLSSSAVAAAAAAAAAAGMAAPPGPGATVGLGLGLGLYNPYAAAQESTFLADQSPFYAAAQNAGHDLKDTLGLNGGPAPGWPYPASMYYPYDPALAAAAYPFGGYGMDLNGARRKNATRETTATLKAWLSEHKKNPYPTKGEKIMLAIITKMTLTQVSTWFANARRRLKKENKMTWEPKNRNDDDDDDDSDAMDGDETTKDKQHASSDRHVSGDLNRTLGRADWSAAGAALKSPCPSEEDGAHRRHDDSDNIDVESDDEELDLLSSDSCLSPSDAGRGPTASSASHPPATTAPVPVKPKIWSLADMAGVNRSSGSGAGGASGLPDASHAPLGSGAAFSSPFANHLTPAFTLRAAPFMAGSNSPGGGKMFPAIHGRLPPSGFPLDSTPYGRPPLYHPHRGYSAPNGGGGVAPALLGDPRLYNVRLPMSSSSESLMAYSKLISSTANASIPFPPPLQRSAASSAAQSGGSLSSSPVENLEKLAALAAVSSASTISTPPTPSSRAEMKSTAGN